MQRFVAVMTNRGGRTGPLGRWFGRAHAALVLRTRGRVGARWFGAPVLILVTVGRRSGATRETPLLYVRADESGAVALLGANAGNDRLPAWWHNLTAATTVDVVIRGRRTTMGWREALGDEHAQLFTAFVEAYPPAGHYVTFTDRALPIAVLTPVV